jgi:CubicO group peptidase (beta-lactamase class C family)
MYLEGGVWRGRRIVSREWVAESTAEVVHIPDSENPIPGYLHGYGLQWWLGFFPNGSMEFYLAAGFGGQFIVVIPAAEMVVAITAGNYEESNNRALLRMVDEHILSAALPG